MPLQFLSSKKHVARGPLLLFKAKCPPTFSATQSRQHPPAHPGPWWPQHPALRGRGEVTAGGVPAVGREGAHPSVLVATHGSSRRAGGEGQCYHHLVLWEDPFPCPPHALWEPCADVPIVTQLCHSVAGDAAHPGHPTALSQSTGVLDAGTEWVSDPMSHSSWSHRHTRSPARGMCQSHGTWQTTKAVVLSQHSSSGTGR